MCGQDLGDIRGWLHNMRLRYVGGSGSVSQLMWRVPYKLVNLAFLSVMAFVALALTAGAPSKIFCIKVSGQLRSTSLVSKLHQM